MKKISVRNLYLIFIICIGLVFLGIGSTYAVFTASSEIISPITLNSNLVYESGVMDTIDVTIPSGETVSATLNITNSSNGALNYVTWYIDNDDDIYVIGESGQMSGTISPSSTSSIVVKIRNYGEDDVTVNIGISSSENSIVLGDNMKAVGVANIMMASGEVSDDTAVFLRSNIKRGEIESITFVDNINIPEGYTGVDVSLNNDSSVMMWYGSKNGNNLYDIYIGAENNVTSLSNGYNLFAYLTNCTSIDFGNNVDTSKVKNLSAMFFSCNNLTSLDVSIFETSNVTGMVSMFRDCSSLTLLDLSHFNTSKVTSMQYMFNNCNSLTNLNVSSFDTSKVTNMTSMFNGCSSLTSLDVSSFDTSNVTSMASMFNDCGKVTELDVSNFDTSSVTNMAAMFDGCSNVTELDVSGFDTSKVTQMWYMFNGCGKVTELDVSGFDTSSVTGSMNNMFNGCSSVTELDVSSFDTSKVTSMVGMFGDCSNLPTIDVSNLDTSNVTRMNGMFGNCSSLTILDLSNFNTINVTDMTRMFAECSNLTTIYVSDAWNVSNVTDSVNMFLNCASLVGSAGTLYKDSCRDRTYAIVDTEGTPGYLTYKSVSV